MSKRKRLIEHLDINRNALNEYSRITEIVKHKTVIGSTREAIISAFLSQNLPKFIEFYSGEIFDSNDNESGQIDIILNPITSPKLNLYNSLNLFPAESVLAAIEIKSLLDKPRLWESLNNCEKTKKLEVKRKGMNNSTGLPIVDKDRIPYIVFCFKSSKKNTIFKHLVEWYSERNKNDKINFRHLPDMILSIEVGNNNKNGKVDKGYCLRKKENWMFAGTELSEIYQEEIDKNPLYYLYNYLVKIIAKWTENPSLFSMPVEDYTTHDENIFFW